MLTLTFSTLLLVASPSDPMMGQPTTVAPENLEAQARLPNAAVFFLPKSSALSPLAADIVARAARNAESRAIIIIQASSDNQAGETATTATDRADVVRRELIRNAVSPLAIRIMYADAFRSGVESRRVIVSIIPTPSNGPSIATLGSVAEGSL